MLIRTLTAAALVTLLAGAAQAQVTTDRPTAERTPTVRPGDPTPAPQGGTALDRAITSGAANQPVVGAPPSTATPTPAPTQVTPPATATGATASATVAAPSASGMASGSVGTGTYASPPRPIPYAMLDEWLRASPRERATRDWWAGT